jgi:DNA-binding NtrC family response regulator
MNQPHILIVDDEPDIRNLISDILADEGYSVATAANGDEANQQLKLKPPNLILLDIWMPDIDGISLMKSWNEKSLVTAPIVMMSGHGTVETAVEATRLGAVDFIEKPLSLAKLLQTVTDSIADIQDQSVLQDTTNQVSLEPIGNSPAITKVKTLLDKIYKTKNHLFIYGESGTGKNTLAKLIHQNRNSLESNCVIIDVSILDDENFEESMTDSNHGSFLQASKGSLIINNFDSLSELQQSKFLYFLKHNQFSLFATNSIRQIDFEIIAISSKDMQRLVDNDLFSAELYELIAEVKLYSPSLSERHEDIPELLNYYINTLPDLEQTPYRKMSFAAQNKLRNYHWKNNIRELKNVVRQLLLDGEGEIGLAEVENHLNNSISKQSSDSLNWYDLPLREAREAFEKDYLIHQLKAVQGRVGELAKIAGMERTHLYRKLRTLNINPKELDKNL